MIVLDTNVVSELMRMAPNANVLTWADSLRPGEAWLTAVTLAELAYGVARLPDGRRRSGLAERLEAMVDVDLGHRVAAFDEPAARHYVGVVLGRQRVGRPISMADAQIAAICRSHGARLATRNVGDFALTGIDIVDPWSAATS